MLLVVLRFACRGDRNSTIPVSADQSEIRSELTRLRSLRPSILNIPVRTWANLFSLLLNLKEISITCYHKTQSNHNGFHNSNFWFQLFEIGHSAKFLEVLKNILREIKSYLGSPNRSTRWKRVSHVTQPTKYFHYTCTSGSKTIPVAVSLSRLSTFFLPLFLGQSPIRSHTQSKPVSGSFQIGHRPIPSRVFSWTRNVNHKCLQCSPPFLSYTYSKQAFVV